eukprot:938667-Amphidinium_carterae.1
MVNSKTESLHSPKQDGLMSNTRKRKPAAGFKSQLTICVVQNKRKVVVHAARTSDRMLHIPSQASSIRKRALI